MTPAVLSVLTGMVAGLLAGAFGVGGGVVTIPALRLVFEYEALVAVGTALAVVVPVAATGALTHARHGHADIKTGLALGVWGGLAAVAGAHASARAGGTVVILVNACVIVWAAASVLRGAERTDASHGADVRRRPQAHVAVLGVTTGLYAGFLGLGGGVVLVPLLHRVFGYPLKTAIGTSLVAIAVLATPGTIAHGALGHVDLSLAIGLAAGAVPGAVIGARLTGVASERAVRTGFALMLVVTGLALGASEAGIV